MTTNDIRKRFEECADLQSAATLHNDVDELLQENARLVSRLGAIRHIAEQWDNDEKAKPNVLLAAILDVFEESDVEGRVPHVEQLPTTCLWREVMEGEWVTWESACGRKWVFEADGPTENEVNFCQGCGKPVAVVDEGQFRDGEKSMGTVDATEYETKRERQILDAVESSLKSSLTGIPVYRRDGEGNK